MTPPAAGGAGPPGARTTSPPLLVPVSDVYQNEPGPPKVEPSYTPDWRFVLCASIPGSDDVLAPPRSIAEVVLDDGEAADAERRAEREAVRATAAADGSFGAGGGLAWLAPWVRPPDVPPEAIVLVPDHAIAIDVHRRDGRPLLHKALFAREGLFVEAAWRRDGLDGRTLLLGEPGDADRVMRHVLALVALDPPHAAEPPGPVPVEVPLAELGAPPAGAWWAPHFADAHSVRLTKTDYFGGRGTSLVTFLRREGAWFRVRVRAQAPGRLEIDFVPPKPVLVEAKRWVVGRAPWADGPFTPAEVGRIHAAQEACSLWQRAIAEARGILLARTSDPALRPRVEAAATAAAQEALAQRARRLDAVEPDAETFARRWRETPGATKIAPAPAPPPPHARPDALAGLVDRALAWLSAPITNGALSHVEGTPLAQGYGAGPVLRYEGPASIATIGAQNVPAVVVARRIPIAELARIQPHLPRVAAFVLEESRLPYEEEYFYASSRRATVKGVADAGERLRAGGFVLVDAVEGRVLLDMDRETIASYERLRRAGRPGGVDQDLEHVVMRRFEREAGAGGAPSPG